MDRILMRRSAMRDQLFQMVGARGIAFVGVTTPEWIKFKRGEVDAHGRAIPNPYIGKVLKISQILAQINFSYENGVINANMREIAQQREIDGLRPLSTDDLREAAIHRYDRGVSWMVPLKNAEKLTPFCIHKKDQAKVAERGIEGVNLYLWIRSLDCIRSQFLNIETGEQVSKDILVPFMDKENKNAGENQGIENKEKRVVPRAFGFDGIATIKTSGEQWVCEEWFNNANASLRRAIEVIGGTLHVPD